MSEARPPYINAATATLTAPRIAPTFFGRNTQALDNNNLASPTTLCLPPAACLAGHTSSPTLSFMSGVDSAAQLPSTSKEERAKAEPPNLTAQQQAQLTALLNFRPSSRDVISGIAPHVFDDQRSSWRARPRRRRRTSSSERRRRSASPAPHRSPLRLSAVISVDEHGALVDSKGDEDVVLAVYTAPPPHAASLPSSPIVTAAPVSSQPETPHNKATKGRSLRIVLKTLVFRLK